MPEFKYKAKGRDGSMADGAMSADSEAVVESILMEKGFSPVFIVRKEVSAMSYAKDFFERFNKVKQEEIIVFARQLSSILTAGIPLLESLEAVYEQVPSAKFKRVIFDLKLRIAGGESFSEALSRHNDVFAPVFVAMVRAGERAGILGEVLDNLGHLMEIDFENAQKIKSAVRYPAMVVSALCIAFVVVVTFVIPKFTLLYSSFKAELPLPTRVLLSINYIAVNFWPVIAAAAVLAAFSARRFIGTEQGRTYFDRAVISVPVIGGLVKKLILARFCRIFSAMLKAGIPMIEALNITHSTVDNKVLAGAIANIREEIVKGSGLSEPMKGSKVFPPLVIQMVAIGERSGSVESMLSKIADYFDRDADYTIKNLTPLLEPLLILVLGIFVTFLALGVFLPMWDMVKIIK